MNTAKRTAKFKGAVLIMILAVMTVLIILLAGSIAVVYSAHNRAVVKYSESQGYYTARSVLDNFFEELSASTDTTDSSGNAVGTYYSLDLANSTVVPNPMCIGRALELDLYKAQVSVYDESGNFAEWVTKFCDLNKDALNSQINEFEGTSHDYTQGGDGRRVGLYGKFANYYVNLNTSKLNDTSTYGQFYQQFTPVSTVAGTNEPNVIRYDLTQFDGFGSGPLDTDGDGSTDTNSQFGKLSDNGAGKVWITVEVTERVFAVGEGSTYADRFKAGKRSDDHIVAKVTAHVIYDNEEITTTQTWISNPPPVVDAETGLSTLGPINDAASITGVGDVATLTQNVSKFSNDPTFSGNVFFEGSLEHNNTDATATMEPGEVFFVGNTYKTSVNCFKGVNTGSIFYARRFQLWSQNSFTQNNTEVNVIAQTFSIHSDQKKVYGRVLAENFDSMSSGSTLSESFVKNTVQTGNMAFNTSGQNIQGDVFCNYLGVPADRVVVKFTGDVATFYVNYGPQGTEIIQDNNKVDNVVADTYKIHVLKGIRIIDGTEEVPIGKDQYGNDVMGLVNTYETYTSKQTGNGDKVVDYFRHAGAAGADVYGTTIAATGLESDFPLKLHPASEAYDPGTEYQVQLNFDKCTKIHNATNLDIDLNLDYFAFIDDNSDGVPDSDNPWKLTDDFYREFTLPTNSLGGKKAELIVATGSTAEKDKFKLPTHHSIYGNYFYDAISSGLTSHIKSGKTFDEHTGSFNMATDGSEDTFTYTFDTFLQEHAITAEAILEGTDIESAVDIVNIPEMDFMTNPVTMGPGGSDIVNDVYMPPSNYVISSSGYISIPSGNEYNAYKSRVHYIDARLNDLEIQLGDGVTNNKLAGAFVVYGDKHVTVTVPGVNGGGDNQVIEIGGSDAAFLFITAEIFDGDSKDAFIIGEPFGGREETPSPNIDWYFSKHIGQVNINTGGGINGAPIQSRNTTLCGYITAPTVYFNIATNVNGIERPTWYYGTKIQPNDNAKYTICGSIFCKEYRGGQHAGVCFIPRDDNYTDDGSKPMINKVGMYRARQ